MINILNLYTRTLPDNLQQLWIDRFTFYFIVNINCVFGFTNIVTHCSCPVAFCPLFSPHSTLPCKLSPPSPLLCGCSFPWHFQTLVLWVQCVWMPKWWCWERRAWGRPAWLRDMFIIGSWWARTRTWVSAALLQFLCCPVTYSLPACCLDERHHFCI